MPLSTSLVGDQLDDDSDDDDIQVTIGNIKSGPSMFPTRQNSRTSIPGMFTFAKFELSSTLPSLDPSCSSHGC